MNNIKRDQLLNQLYKYSRVFVDCGAIFKCIAVAALILMMAALNPAAADNSSSPSAEYELNPGDYLKITEGKTLSLKHCVEFAMENHPSVKGTRWSVEAAEQKIRQAKSAFIPDVTWSATKSRTGYNATDTITDLDTFTWTATQPIWTGGSTQVAWDMAQLERKMTKLSQTQTRQQIMLEVIQAFFGALRSRDMVKVAEEGLELITEHLNVAKARYDAGAAVASDVLRAQVQEASMQESVIQAHVGYEQALERLGVALGIRLPETVNLKWNGIHRECVDFEPFKNALEDSAVMKLAVDAVRMAYNGVRLARAGLRPSVAVQGSINDSEDRWPPRNDGRVWSVALRTDMNVLDGGLVRGKLAQAEAEHKKAEKDLENQVNALESGLRTSWLTLKAAEAGRAVTAKGLESAEESFRLTKVRYGAGTALSVELLEDQLNLVKARNASLESIYGCEQAMAGLYYSAGLIEEFPLNGNGHVNVEPQSSQQSDKGVNKSESKTEKPAKKSSSVEPSEWKKGIF